MTKFDKNWVAAEEAKRQWMAENGLYREEYEHASCGVGLVVSIDGSQAERLSKTGLRRLRLFGTVVPWMQTGKQAMVRVSTFKSLFPFSMIKCAVQVMNHVKVN